MFGFGSVSPRFLVLHVPDDQVHEHFVAEHVSHSLQVHLPLAPLPQVLANRRRLRVDLGLLVLLDIG